MQPTGSTTGPAGAAVALPRAERPAAAPVAGRTLTARETAWLAAIPTAIVTLGAIVLVGPVLGRALLTPRNVQFWVPFQVELHPEPVEQGRFLVSLVAPLLLAALTAAGVRPRPRRARLATDVLVVAVQAAAVAFAALCLLQQETELLGSLYPVAERTPILIDYFSVATLLVAAAGTLVVATAVRSERLRTAVAGLLADTRGRRVAAGAVAVAAIAVWLMHAVYTEDTIALAYHEVTYHIQFTMDETFAVLDGRSPLVDFAAQYGSLWPYAFAGGMSLLGATVGVWVAMALAVTAVGMLAIYGVLRRAARSSLGGLLLFAPVLATSFFMVAGTLDNRYTYANYFGTFPMRYAGPSILAWLVARRLGGAGARRSWPLFLAAGLVVLNNADAGVPALGATVAALLWSAGRPKRAGLARLVLEALAGLLSAFALVSVLTLARAGALPDLGLLLRYSRLFAREGFGMYPMPAIGLHLVMYLTYVAALGVATVRALRAEPDRLLTGMLAWSGAFGLGVGSYFAGRSTPDNLPAMFFPWSFAVALLLLPALGALRDASWRRPPLAAAACLFAFLVTACSLAQTPTPWGQLRRLQRTGPPILTRPIHRQFVARHTHRGEPAAILLLLGHRIGADLGVVNVSPYSSNLTMPTAEQFKEAIAALEKAGGDKIFVEPSATTPDMRTVLAGAGFRQVAQDRRGVTALWVGRGGG
jgi:hypothetical protein